MSEEHNTVYEMHAEWRKRVIEHIQHESELCNKEFNFIKDGMKRIDAKIDKTDDRITDLVKDGRKLGMSLLIAVFVAMLTAAIQFIVWIIDKVR